DNRRPPNPYLESNPRLSAKIDGSHFRYINGSLFERNLDPATFNRRMRDELLDCLNFDWGQISPAIFGSMFQGVMDKDQRREIGAHYTSEENILKLINPLFMDDLRTEFERAKKKKSTKALADFHDKLASLKFLDPACGCGNFLIIAYRELRQLELEVVKAIAGYRHQLIPANIEHHLKVNVDQFYGIEIEEWPCQIARTGMWLMDHLMNLEATAIFERYEYRLPLKQSATIVHANAHRIDWETIVPKNQLSYILGNPPFVGASMMSPRQKAEAVVIFGKIKLSNSIDYVGAWYHKAAAYIQDTAIKVAFVSTNSITQGEQVTPFWGRLFGEYAIHIDFAYRTFKWESEATGKAAVHCVIIGFSKGETKCQKIIYDSNGTKILAKNINAYLVDAPNVLVASRSKPISNVTSMVYGNKPSDGGNLILTAVERKELVAKEPDAKKLIKPYVGSVEFINGTTRYCLWLKDVQYSELKNCPLVRERIKKVKEFRLKSTAKPTVEKAEMPHLFFFISQSDKKFLVMPRVSSENRKYIPIGFLNKNTICSDSNSIVPNATLYHFGILTSLVHMAWMRAVGGRLKSDYRYSGSIVYNNFPWPDATDKQKAEIEELAQAVLDAREQYPESTFADMYGENSMAFHPKLVKAHEKLDKAVMKLYGFAKDMSEQEIVAELMELYQGLAGGSEF
ncbi:MAG: hypothetical protein FWG02_09935, partial [Holophagaceae bacterium]|nr:hypothetical protein [Holophagaceae bacterium]